LLPFRRRKKSAKLAKFDNVQFIKTCILQPEYLNKYNSKNGLLSDINETRRNHEIYLSDPRKTEISKLKTVLRIPVKG